MDTIRIPRSEVKLVAHRGLSGIETENTCAAFIAAGNRDYYGIETDTHRTADGAYVVIHDDRTGRVAFEDIPVEASTLEQLQAVALKAPDGSADPHAGGVSEDLRQVWESAGAGAEESVPPGRCGEHSGDCQRHYVPGGHCLYLL